IAISSAVPFLKFPPIPTYKPSVFSRKTMNCTSFSVRSFSGVNFLSNRTHGRAFTYKSSLNRSPSKISAAWTLVGTRGSPIAPSKIASKSRWNISTASAGKVVPSFRYRSAPQSNSFSSTAREPAAAAARRTFTASGITSFPIPSPGITAMRFGADTLFNFDLDEDGSGFACGASVASVRTALPFEPFSLIVERSAVGVVFMAEAQATTPRQKLKFEIQDISVLRGCEKYSPRRIATKLGPALHPRQRLHHPRHQIFGLRHHFSYPGRQWALASQHFRMHRVQEYRNVGANPHQLFRGIQAIHPRHG